MNQAPDPEFIKQTFPEPVLPACSVLKLLRGQKAIVTGASSGIGKAIAIALGHAGADVAVNYVSGSEDAEAVAQEVTRCGARAMTIRADVSKEDEVQAMMAQVVREWGTFEILVNNAGIQKDAALHEMTLAQWQRVIDVNLTGQFLCTREAVREYRRRGVEPGVSCAAGKIICVSSVHEVIPWAGHVNYAASKGGVMLMMKSIAQSKSFSPPRCNMITGPPPPAEQKFPDPPPAPAADSWRSLKRRTKPKRDSASAVPLPEGAPSYRSTT